MNDLKLNNLNTLTRMKYITTKPTAPENILNKPQDTLTNLKEYNSLINKKRNIFNSKLDYNDEKKIERLKRKNSEVLEPRKKIKSEIIIPVKWEKI